MSCLFWESSRKEFEEKQHLASLRELHQSAAEMPRLQKIIYEHRRLGNRMYRLVSVLCPLGNIPRPRILSKVCPGCGIASHFCLLLSISSNSFHPLKQGKDSDSTLQHRLALNVLCNPVLALHAQESSVSKKFQNSRCKPPCQA